MKHYECLTHDWQGITALCINEYVHIWVCNQTSIASMLVHMRISVFGNILNVILVEIICTKTDK